MVVVLATLTIVIAMMSLIIVRMQTITKTCTILISVLVRTRWDGATQRALRPITCPPPLPSFLFGSFSSWGADVPLGR